MVRLTDHLDMTIVVDWDVKSQIKQTKLSYTLHIVPFPFLSIALPSNPALFYGCLVYTVIWRDGWLGAIFFFYWCWVLGKDGAHPPSG